MNYYKVTYTINTPRGKAESTEIMTAREGSAIVDACKYRFGKHLVSVEYKEINERRIKPNTSIYVAI